MGRIVTAFQAFFRILFDGRTAADVRDLLQGVKAAPAPTPTSPASAPTVVIKGRPAANDALNLLAALQREARLIDFLQESLDGYADAQIGTAVRDVHRDARAALARMFDLRPLTDQAEGSEIEVPAGFDAVRFRLTGNVAGSPPLRGRVCHHGWQATKCDLPQRTGDVESLKVVAPIEVEVS